jgi:hypothetical protein
MIPTMMQVESKRESSCLGVAVMVGLPFLSFRFSVSGFRLTVGSTKSRHILPENTFILQGLFTTQKKGENFRGSTESAFGVGRFSAS